MVEIKNKDFTGDGLYLFEPTRVSNCRFYNIEGWNHHGMELNGNGSQTEYVIENCIFDNTQISPDAYDEGCAIINAPIVTFNRCRFKNFGKACLVGNGDHNEADKKLRVSFNECIFEGNGRRSPYIQFGQAFLNRCLIKNWGNPKFFYLKAHGLRVGGEAQCFVKDTVFSQGTFWPGFKNFWSDVTNQYDPILIPGNFRAAYAEKGGILELENCYFNSWFLYKRGKINGKMSKSDANDLVEFLENSVPKI